MIRAGSVEIQLDTSFLIRALVTDSAESRALRSWPRSGQAVSISTLVWGEFLCGPLEDGVEELAGRVVRRHVSLGTDQAAAAARLFDETRRDGGEGASRTAWWRRRR